jgi:hypothetical protein
MLVQAQLHSKDVVTKQDDSPVTIADYAAQAIVAWVLQQSTESRCIPTIASCLGVRRYFCALERPSVHMSHAQVEFGVPLTLTRHYHNPHP